MRNIARLAAMTTALTCVLVAAPAVAHAAGPSSRLAVVTVADGPALAVTTAEVAKARSTTGKSMGAKEAEALAAASGCRSHARTVTGENAFGGMLFRFRLELTWCYDGYSATYKAETHSTETAKGWYFHSWTNSPNTYYDEPNHYEAHAVGQAKFCVAWCANSATPGSHIIGRRDGTSTAGDL